MFQSAFNGFAQGLKRASSGVARKSKTFRTFMMALNAEPSFTSADYSQFVREAYEENPYVYAVITQIANSAAGVPPSLYRVTGSGRVASALDGYDRKAHHGRRETRKLRLAIGQVQKAAAKRHRMRTGAPYAVSKAIVTKALVRTGELEPIEGHELLDLLLYPNDWYQRSYQQFIQAYVTHLEIGGENFMEPVGPDNGPPREVYLLPPKDIQLKKGTGDHPIREVVFQGYNRKTLRYDPDPAETEVFYSRYYNPINPLRGLSPAHAAAMSIDVNNQGRRWNLSLLQNGAALSGIISSKGPLSKEQVESIRERFNRKHAGADNAGKVVAVDEVEGVDFTPISQTAKDVQWGDLSRMTALECAIVWGVPPEIIGHDASKTYANYEEARRAFYLEKVIPLMDFIYGELNTSLVPLFGEDLWLDYDTEAIDALSDDVNELHERVREDIDATLITINEGRESIGREKVDGGDVLLSDLRKVPLETVVNSSSPLGPADPEEDAELAYGKGVRERAIEALSERGLYENGTEE